MSARNEPPGFDPIWQAIKGWDIQRVPGAGYHGPTGDDVRTILSALTAAGYAVEQGWQPIETAPRDGTLVLLYAPQWSDCHGVGQWDHNGQTWVVGGIGGYGPIQWRPLPAPPAGEGSDDA